MKHAKIGELRNRLSYYLRFVRRGQPVLVFDRDRAIARIDPVREAAPGADWPAALLQSGVLRAPTKPLPLDWLRARPRVKANVVAAVIDERRSGR